MVKENHISSQTSNVVPFVASSPYYTSYQQEPPGEYFQHQIMPLSNNHNHHNLHLDDWNQLPLTPPEDPTSAHLWAAKQITAAAAATTTTTPLSSTDSIAQGESFIQPPSPWRRPHDRKDFGKASATEAEAAAAIAAAAGLSQDEENEAGEREGYKLIIGWTEFGHLGLKVFCTQWTS